MSQWMRHPELSNDTVSVNGTLYTFEHGVVKVEKEQDVAVFEEYLRCSIVPEEVAKSLVATADSHSNEADIHPHGKRKTKG